MLAATIHSTGCYAFMDVSWKWLMPILATGCGALSPAGASRLFSLDGAARGAIVPMSSRGGERAWAELRAACVRHPDVPVIVVINPASGPDVAVAPAFTDLIAQLAAARAGTVGYVFTRYARRAARDVTNEIDRYRTFYPRLDGIFLDEMSNRPGDEPYYRALTAYARKKGYRLIIGNPGVATPASFIDTVDVLLIYESRGLPRLGELAAWRRDRDPRNFGIVSYGVPAFDADFVARAKSQLGYIYITDGDGEDPWRRLSSYFESLLQALAPRPR